MLYVDSNDKFHEVLDILRKSELIGIDTEFVRRETYFAKLCLVQISTNDQIFVIDPLSVRIDELAGVLLDENITKIFHAPHQDLGIFYHDYNVITKNIFDIQSSIKFLGIRNQISYQDACKKILNVEIEKTQQFREWNIRPLPLDMIEYAAQDVLYLIPIYQKLKKMMEEKQNFRNFCHFMNEMFCKKEFYQVDFEEIWKKIKPANRSIKITNNIRSLASLREEFAISLDLPRNHVFSDNDLVKISEHLPSSDNELKKFGIKFVSDAKVRGKLFDFCAGLKKDNKN